MPIGWASPPLMKYLGSNDINQGIIGWGESMAVGVAGTLRGNPTIITVARNMVCSHSKHGLSFFQFKNKILKLSWVDYRGK